MYRPGNGVAVSRAGGRGARCRGKWAFHVPSLILASLTSVLWGPLLLGLHPPATYLLTVPCAVKFVI